MNTYIGCGLTHVPRDTFTQYTRFIHALAEGLREDGCERVEYALINSDPQLAEKPFDERARLCYSWDREMVERAELFVAEATYPSTGLGIELQIAAAKNIPIIICFRETNQATDVTYENPDHTVHSLQIGNGYVSLMALGIPSVFRIIRYGDDGDGISKVIASVNLMRRDISP